jgi:acyl-CoA synthetase (NDP forming)
MAGNRQMWEAFFKQTGALPVGSIDEMSDLSMTFLKVKPFAGTGVAVFGGGGGNNVATADTCAEEGLDLPPPSPQTRARLLEFTTLVNQSIVNPMDAGSLFASTALLQRALDAVCAEPQVQVVILHMGADYAKWLSPQALVEFKAFIVDYNRSSPAGKPVIVAVQEQEKAAESAEFVQDVRQSGITTYSSLRRAARALRRFSSYHRSLSSRSC